MYFAVFDFEYEKEPAKLEGNPDGNFSKLVEVDGQRYFMLDESLYRIGLDCVCFTEQLFVKWIGYSLF